MLASNKLLLSPTPSPVRALQHGQLTASIIGSKQRPRRSIRAQQPGDVIVQGIVSAMTESLRALGIGQQQYQEIQQQAPVSQPLPAGDVTGVMERLRADFDRAYFATGIIDDSIYEADCVFADPTVRFTGLDLWKRNLQLLVPFLVQPEIQLTALRQLCSSGLGGPQQLQADWTLKTGLALPWRPSVNVRGTTVYTLNEDSNKVTEHVESWDIGPWQALVLIFTPGRA